ncbi:MAG: twitching motility protein PilT [Deltaproteobacteria bacterium]|nr:twitching motility protein PilT [Deltaproteobacteria bacterium]MBW2051673.1 twitching motility protein PilT [Deltaproteobacteria bacterium]MBW2140195.1 twitching motility protein PilT [Deltaproteobacteria bacterium]MBW2324278.1 twitching motility protein PilT [Deltaproteobacteria bacterium]
MKITVFIRFYEELNDYLPPAKQKHEISITVENSCNAGRLIDFFGIPHSEVDLILVNGKPAHFSYILQNRDRLSVYPVFETFDISGVSKLREKPLREPRFILDHHLETLFKYLTVLGVNAKLHSCSRADHLMNHARAEKRTLLTIDKEILKGGRIVRGYRVVNTEPLKQLEEVLEYFDLYSRLSDLKS